MEVETINDFDIYLEKYCNLYGYDPEEAKKHALVREVASYYDNVNKKEVHDANT